MVKANDEVNQYPRIKEGVHLLKVESVGDKGPSKNGKTTIRKWIISCLDEEIEPMHINLVPWIQSRLLVSLGLGYEVVDGKIDWDTDDVIGAKFKAVVTYNEKGYPNLDMFQAYDAKHNDEEIPF